MKLSSRNGRVLRLGDGDLHGRMDDDAALATEQPVFTSRCHAVAADVGLENSRDGVVDFSWSCSVVHDMRTREASLVQTAGALGLVFSTVLRVEASRRPGEQRTPGKNEHLGGAD